MSDFDDLLNFGTTTTTTTTNQPSDGGDPFDLFGSSQPVSENGGGGSTSGGNLLDFGFDAQVSTQNDSSAKVNFEANTNPLYEFNNTTQQTTTSMASDPVNPLFDLTAESPKEGKAEPSNPLYDFMENEGKNGHDVEVALTNGNGTNGGETNVDLMSADVDLLGNTGDLITTEPGNGLITTETGDDLITTETGDDLMATEPSDDSGVTADANNTGEIVQEEEEVTQEEEEVTQEKSRSCSESSEPEQIKTDQQDTQGDTSGVVSEITTETPSSTENLAQDAGILEEVTNGTGDDTEAGATTVEKSADRDAEDADGPETGTKDEEADIPENKEDQGNARVEEDKVEKEIDVEGTTVVPEEERKDKAGEVVSETVENVESTPELVEEQTDQFNDAEEDNKDEKSVTQNDIETTISDAAPEEHNEKPAEEEEQMINDNVSIPEKELAVIDNEVSSSEIGEAAPESIPETVGNDENITNPESEQATESETQEPIPELSNEESDKSEVPICDADAEQASLEANTSDVVEQEPVSETDANKPGAEEGEGQLESVEVTEEEPAQPAEPVASDMGETTEQGDQPPPEAVDDSTEVEAVEPAADVIPDATPESAVHESTENVPEATPEEADQEPKEDVTAATSNLAIGQEEEQQTQQEPVADDSDTRNSEQVENGVRVNGTSEVTQNGVEEDEAVRDPNIVRETREKEEVHFAEMNNVRQKFESGVTDESEPTPRHISIKDEYAEGGEYESTPVKDPDVVRESDNTGEELPEVGMAKNLLDKFKSIQKEKAQTVTSGKRVSPPRDSDRVEYESQPTERMEQYEGKSDTGVFESSPEAREDVVRSDQQLEDVQPEKGTAKNVLSKFKEIESESANYQSREKREITPDRSGKVEYVSEPRGESIVYNETQSESGVFESTPKLEEDVVRSEDVTEDILPEAGAAKNILSKFKQLESEVGNKPPPVPKPREITPDRSGKVEFVSEPRGFLEKYEPKEESGVFESQPAEKAEVVRSDETQEDVLPEAGAAKKTLEMFKEMQKQSSSPVYSPPRKAITPPRETSPGKTVVGVVESTPEERPDVVKSGEVVPEDLPTEGTAKNILNKFKQIQSGSPSTSPSRKQKEMTPPPESGVYENTPDEHLVIETRQSESGILESTPTRSTDIAREADILSPEAELPESGMAKNLVSKFRQLESSAKNSASPSPRFKEFTPPRDSRGPLSPKSPAGSSEGVHPSELPGQYQQQESAGVFENEPEVKSDVFREADTDWSEGMPKANTTSSMLEKFRGIQKKAVDEQDAPAPVSRKEKGMFKTIQTEKCAACEKTVYAMEKLEMNNHVYHRNCFKCSHCSARLTAKTFSMNEGVIYCVNHFKQLFARKGNYDEGFGRQQYKKRWQGDEQPPEGATA